jgi:hypothetical protein
LLTALVNDEGLFPLRLTLRGPDSAELARAFSDVQRWIAELIDGQAGHYRIVWRNVKHRIIGENSVPEQIWIDDSAVAFALIRKQHEADRFQAIVNETRQRYPELLVWLSKRPLEALDLAGDWPRLLAVIDWLKAHPRPGIYLRQIDIPGIDTKFTERHRGALAQLLDATLPADAIDSDATGLAAFCARYGFRDKPSRLRFRILDPHLALLPREADQDITVNHDAFATLQMPVRRVFVTENETNFLAFPTIAESIVVFGGGYGFDALTEASWLHKCRIHYWGDIDTHGFAILDQLRAHVPHARSLLMDRRTLLAHRAFWDVELRPQTRDLERLNEDEAELFDDLRHNRLDDRVRLEQERVSFACLLEAIEALDRQDD